MSLDVSLLRDAGCARLVRCLEDSDGPKDLVIDPSLMKMLDRLIQVSTLREHGVEKIYKLSRLPPPNSGGARQRVYLTRASPQAVKLIVDHVKHYEQQRQQEEQQLQAEGHTGDIQPLKVAVVCVPRVVFAARAVLEEEGLGPGAGGAGGIGASVSLQSFCPDFLPLDDDLLTLEMPAFFREVFVEGEFGGCAGVGAAMCGLYGLYGRPHRTLAHGRAAHSVMQAIAAQGGGGDGGGAGGKSELGTVFIFDRDADLVTPLLTQLTYEGTLDEHFGIQAGVIEVPTRLLGDDAIKGPAKKLLNSQDKVFDEIRCKHFSAVWKHLQTVTKEIKSKQMELESSSVSKVKEFIENDLRGIQAQKKSVSLHLSLCEAITKEVRKDFDVQLSTEHGLVTGDLSFTDAKAYIEDCCARQLPANTCLRLLCLLSLTQSNGLSARDYDELTAQIVAACGYKHLITLFELRQAGLLCVSESTDTPQTTAIKGLRQAASNLINRDQDTNWRFLTKCLKLIPDREFAIDLYNPNHMSYVYNGMYTPVLPQIVDICLKRGVSAVTEALKFLPGITHSEGWGADGPDASLPPVVLVLVLGGVTFAEIAALRMLAVHTRNRIIVASTGTTTGNKIMSSITSNAASTGLPI